MDTQQFYNSSQLYRDELVQFLRMFARRERWPDNLDGVEKQAYLDKELTGLLTDLKAILAVQRTKLELPRDHLSETEARFGVMHPAAVGQSLLKKLPFSPREKANLNQLLTYCFPKDQTTDYYAKRGMPVMVGLAHLFANLAQEQEATSSERQKSDKHLPVCLIEGDFTNLKNCNQQIGEALTDKLISKISATVRARLEEAGAKEVQCIRAGGDEVRLITYGLAPEKLKQVLNEQIHPELNLLAAQYGLHTLEHSKEGKLPGFGAAFACAELNRTSLPNDIFNHIETDIKYQKKCDGFMRLGIASEPQIEHYLKGIFIQGIRSEVREELALKGRPTQEAVEAETERRAREKEPGERREAQKIVEEYVKPGWHRLTGRDGLYQKEYLQSGTYNPKAFFDSQRPFSKKEQVEHIEAIPERSGLMRKDIVPFLDQEPLLNKEPLTKSNANAFPRNEDPEIHRLRLALLKFGFPKLAKANADIFLWNPKTRQYDFTAVDRVEDHSRARLQHMVIDLMHYYDAHDPASLCKSPALLKLDAEDFLKRKGATGIRELRLQLRNLSGLNDVTPELADAALKETGTIIQETMRLSSGSHGDIHISDYVYHLGGGNYSVLLPGDYSDAGVDTLCRKISREVDLKIGKASILTFAKNTYANPDPKNYRFEANNTRKLFLNPDNNVTNAQGARHLISEKRIEALEKRLSAVAEKTNSSLMTMSDIPSPRKSRTLGVNCFPGRVIRPGDNVEACLTEMHQAAQKVFDASNQLPQGHWK